MYMTLKTAPRINKSSIIVDAKNLNTGNINNSDSSGCSLYTL